jgi:hypothetical protein
VCGFCERNEKAQRAALKRRWIAGGVLGGLLLGGLVVAGGAALWARSRERKTPVAPEPTKPRPLHVDVTHETVSVDAEKVWELPPFIDQGRVGAKAKATNAEIKQLLTAALEKAALARPHEPGVVEVSFAADTPVKVVTQLWPKLPGHSTRLSVKSSPLGPATTVYSPPGSPPIEPVAIQVEVRTHGVSIDLRREPYISRVGIGCTPDSEGLAVMLRRPSDYATLKRCLEKLRAEVPKDKPAHPYVWALEGVPAARLFHVISLLRCGEVQCAEDQPRRWDLMGVGASEEYSHAPHEAIPIVMMRLEPALKKCWETTRAALPEPSYESELWLTVDVDAQVTTEVAPGLPPPLEACVERVLAQTELKLPLARTDTRYLVPLPFGD